MRTTCPIIDRIQALETENALMERDNDRLAEINRSLEHDIDTQRAQLVDLRNRLFEARKALEGRK